MTHEPTPEPDWYLQDWMRHFRKKQASLVNELGWSKNRASIVWHSQQPYRREVVNELAAWLGIQPYELLMPPADALGLRALRDTARAIAAGTTSTGDVSPAARPATTKRKG